MAKWGYTQFNDGKAYIYDQDGKFVCNVDISQGLQNLYLIVNAPDLLEAAELGKQYVEKVDASLAFTPKENRVTAPDLSKLEKAIEDATAGMWDNKPKEDRK